MGIGSSGVDWDKIDDNMDDRMNKINHDSLFLSCSSSSLFSFW